MNEPDWPDSRLKRFQIAAIVAAGYPVMALLFRTLRWRVEGQHHFDTLVASGRPPILGLWHGRILPAVFVFRNRDVVAMTSQNFDGEWIARIMRRFGYRSARGSSSRNAPGALRHLIREVRAGRATAFTLDGPRGPARQAKTGAVWLASATGSPLLPFHIEARRHWTLGSWDQTQIPKPFSRVAVVIGEPMDVPRQVDQHTVEGYRRALEDRLAALQSRALAMLASRT